MLVHVVERQPDPGPVDRGLAELHHRSRAGRIRFGSSREPVVNRCTCDAEIPVERRHAVRHDPGAESRPAPLVGHRRPRKRESPAGSVRAHEPIRASSRSRGFTSVLLLVRLLLFFCRRPARGPRCRVSPRGASSTVSVRGPRGGAPASASSACSRSLPVARRIWAGKSPTRTGGTLVPPAACLQVPKCCRAIPRP